MTSLPVKLTVSTQPKDDTEREESEEPHEQHTKEKKKKTGERESIRPSDNWIQENHLNKTISVYSFKEMPLGIEQRAQKKTYSYTVNEFTTKEARIYNREGQSFQ